MGGYTYGFEFIYAHANGGQRLILGDFSTLLLVLFFACSNSASQWTWSLSLWLGWLANELQPSACLHGSSMSPTPSRVTEMYLHTQCLHRWGYKLWSSWLLYRHFADWAISLTHGDFNFLLQQCSCCSNIGSLGYKKLSLGVKSTLFKVLLTRIALSFSFWNICICIMRYLGAMSQSKHKTNLYFIYSLQR